MPVLTYLSFGGNCREALDFYRSVFGGEYVRIQTFGDGPPDMGVPDSDRGKIMHATLTVGDGVIMGSDMPNCHGFTRPITITAPKGTVTNAVPPGACGARGISGFRMIDCLFGALAQVVPDKVAADGCGG